MMAPPLWSPVKYGLLACATLLLVEGRLLWFLKAEPPVSAGPGRESPPLLCQPPWAAGSDRAVEPARGDEELVTDVVLITVAALRADHVHAYGTRRSRTPYLDELAQKGTLFARAYGASRHTPFFLASLLTGRYVQEAPRRSATARASTLADLLGVHGFRTAAIYLPTVLFKGADRLRQYQDADYGFQYVKQDCPDAQAAAEEVIRFFEREQPRRALVWADLRGPADSSLANADAAIGRLLSYLQRTRPGALLLVTTDRGQALPGQGAGVRSRERSLRDGPARVPLLAWGAQLQPQIVHAPVELVDVVPTVLRLVGIPWVHGLRGTSLKPWLNRRRVGGAN